MEEEMRTENWMGYDIRFININGEWYAILKDICDALRLRTDAIAQRLDPDMLVRVPVEIKSSIPSKYNKYHDIPSKVVMKSKDDPISNVVNFNTFNKTVHMLAVNEIGIYEALYASRRLEARKFRRWSAEVMTKLRKSVGLEGYEVMNMTKADIQEQINDILDSLYYDQDTKVLMISITVQGGDVEQIPFKDFNK